MCSTRWPGTTCCVLSTYGDVSCCLTTPDPCHTTLCAGRTRAGGPAAGRGTGGDHAGCTEAATPGRGTSPGPQRWTGTRPYRTAVARGAGPGRRRADRDRSRGSPGGPPLRLPAAHHALRGGGPRPARRPHRRPRRTWARWPRTSPPVSPPSRPRARTRSSARASRTALSELDLVRPGDLYRARAVRPAGVRRGAGRADACPGPDGRAGVGQSRRRALDGPGGGGERSSWPTCPRGGRRRWRGRHRRRHRSLGRCPAATGGPGPGHGRPPWSMPQCGPNSPSCSRRRTNRTRRGSPAMAERYVLLGLARTRCSWFGQLSHWSTTGVAPIEFIKCLSADEARAVMGTGRRVSAFLVDGGLNRFDRDLVASATEAGAPTIVVEDRRNRRDWSSLGCVAALDEDFTRDQLVEVLDRHARVVDRTVHRPVASDRPGRRPAPGRMVAVTGTAGAVRRRSPWPWPRRWLAHGAGRVALVDGARRADLAMYHDVGDVIPGLPELVDLHRRDRSDPEEVRSLLFGIDDRGYDLLLGLPAVPGLGRRSGPARSTPRSSRPPAFPRPGGRGPRPRCGGRGRDRLGRRRGPPRSGPRRGEVRRPGPPGGRARHEGRARPAPSARRVHRPRGRRRRGWCPWSTGPPAHDRGAPKWPGP